MLIVNCSTKGEFALRVSLNWIKDYVDITTSPEELAEALTRAGIAVDAIEYLGNEISEIFVGLVKEAVQHPNADKLSLCTVDINELYQDLQIVCGAPNVKKGQKVVVALPGASLPGDIKISKAKIRGTESYGMICSGQELGMDGDLIPEEQRDGILVLDESTTIGTDAKKLLGLDDVILVLDLTPNRADCLSMINVAREVAAVTGGKVKLPEITMSMDSSISNKVSVDIVAEDLCERYVARVVKDIKIEPSPLWMQKRLQASGVRPISNVVDITNYVMLEMGQPLHAFDYDLVAQQKIIVRRAEDGEIIKTLDQKERKLHNEMLVIADPEKAIALAGVMGGYDTEVTGSTKNLIIESAYFHPINTRKTSKELGLRSEASLRFEKGTIDKERVDIAANRACQLLGELAGGKVVMDYVDNYPIKHLSKTIVLRKSRANATIGVNLSAEEIKGLLEKIELGIEITSEDTMKISVPSYRSDITGEIDIIEEIARLYGFDNIPMTMPFGTIERSIKPKINVIEQIVRNSLKSSGSMEVITYSFINENAYNKLNVPEGHSLRNTIKVANPLSEDGAIMRTTLVSNLLDVYVRNKSRRIEDVNIFEIGRIFTPTGELLPKETNILSVLISGKAWKGWNWDTVPLDFYYLKGMSEQIAENFNLNFEFLPETEVVFLHPGRAARIKVQGNTIGTIGELHPLVKESYEIDNPVYLLELDLDKISNIYDAHIDYREIGKYPTVERDLAILLKEDLNVNEAEKIIERSGGELLKDFHLFDVYRGKQVPEGYKSLAFSLVYQSLEKTLTDLEVNEIHERIQKDLAERLGAQLR